jgi:Flp pilus assembly protein TadD/cell division protein FtsN
MLLGMLALALPTAGCATFSHLVNPASAPAPAKEAAATPLPAKFPQGTEAEVGVFLAQAQKARASGDAQTASSILAQLVLLAPDDPRVLGEYGKVLAGQGRSDDALAFLRRAIEIEPGDWTLYSARGVALDQETKYPAAQVAYGRALELKPGEPVVLNNDALSHMQAGDLKGAEDLLVQVSPQSPGYPQIARTLALLATYKSSAPVAAAQAPAPTLAESKPEAPPAFMAPPVVLPPSVAPLAEALPPPAPVASAELPPPVENEIILDPIPATLTEIKPAPVKLEPAPAKPVQQAATLVRPASNQYDALRADPTVVMERLPVETAPQPAQPAPVMKPKPVVAKPVFKAEVESKPQPLPAAATGKPKAIPANLTVKAYPENHASTNPAGIYVQAGAYLTEARAKQAAAGLESLDVKIMEASVNGRDMFRLRIGPFASMSEAKAAFAQAQALGRSDLMIVKE